MQRNRQVIRPVICAMCLAGAPLFLRAAGPPSGAVSSLATSASSVVSTVTANPSSATSGATPGNVDPSAVVMIENRARVFGNETNAAGVRYYAVTDSDLRGKTPAEIIQLLSPPPVREGEGVRKVETVVDLRHPLTLYTDGSDFNVGTAVVQSSSSRPIEVQSYIFGADLTVINKKP